MHPILLVGLIVGGLVLIDVLLRFAGKRGGGRLQSGSAAIDQFRREYPEVELAALGEVVLTPDERNAFIAMRSGSLGFVRGMGDRFVIRQLRPDDVQDLSETGETSLNIRFSDVTLRRLRFDFSSRADRDFVAAALRPRLLR